MTTEAWLAILGIVQGANVVILGFFLSVLWSMKDTLKELSVAIAEIRVWAHEHEKIDDERYKEIRNTLRGFGSGGTAGVIK